MIATKIELRKAAHESGDYEQCVENNYTYLYNAASVANDDDEETIKPTMSAMTLPAGGKKSTKRKL